MNECRQTLIWTYRPSSALAYSLIHPPLSKQSTTTALSHLHTSRISCPLSIPLPGASSSRRRRASSGILERKSTAVFRAEAYPRAYPMCYSIPVSDAFIPVSIQEDAQTRSSDRAHASETRIVGGHTVTRRRRHRQGHGAGVEVAPVAARKRAMAHRQTIRWEEGKEMLAGSG
jgi:hypothetical protein